MTKLIVLVAAIFCGCFLVTSCNDNNECDILIDPLEVPVCFIVRDAQGNNLLDPEFEGNILGNNIEVTRNGSKYPLILSEYDSSHLLGLHVGKTGPDKIPCIMFWYFYIGKDSGRDGFTIDWGDGVTDEVKINLYYTVVRCEAVSHTKLYLNGKLQPGSSLTVSIVK